VFVVILCHPGPLDHLVCQTIPGVKPNSARHAVQRGCP
jgi:hypothetical protein